jgi:hypothetical protein
MEEQVKYHRKRGGRTRFYSSLVHRPDSPL